MTFARFWGAAGFLGALLIGVYIVARKMPKKHHFVLRALICTVAMSAVQTIYNAVLYANAMPDAIRLLFGVLDSFSLYCISALSVWFCFSCDIWAVLFCATAGYCMQHMSQRTYAIIATTLLPNLNEYLDALLLIAVTAAYYIILYITMIKKADYRGTMLDSRVQVIVSFIAVLITIFLNSYALRAAAGMMSVRLYIMVFSVLSAVLVFYVEFGWLAAKQAEIEKNTIRQIAEADREHYLVEKDIIDLVNVKCHDLKHQLSTLDNELSAETISSLQQTINIYDSIFKTGNRALDITLTRNSLLCERKNITFTCSVNGSKLSFLSDEEVYSLFSNLLDNAIEAVDRVTMPTKRLISLTSYERGSVFVIHAENYFAGTPIFDHGLPQTTKEDKQYHGFGTKSIKMISEKHHGTCTMNVTDDVFEVDILFSNIT